MTKAYSLDLRRKVFAAWQNGEGSQAAVGARFGLSESFVGDLATLHRQSGDVVPRARGGRRSLATPAALTQLGGLVMAPNNDIVAEYHAGMLAAGFALSAPTVGRMLLRLRQTRKKRRSRTTRPASERVKDLRAARPRAGRRDQCDLLDVLPLLEFLALNAGPQLVARLRVVPAQTARDILGAVMHLPGCECKENVAHTGVIIVELAPAWDIFLNKHVHPNRLLRHRCPL